MSLKGGRQAVGTGPTSVFRKLSGALEGCKDEDVRYSLGPPAEARAYYASCDEGAHGTVQPRPAESLTRSLARPSRAKAACDACERHAVHGRADIGGQLGCSGALGPA